MRKKTENRKTYPHETYELLIADSFVRLIDRWRTLWFSPVAETFVSTAVVVSAFITEFHLTFGRTARTL